MGNVEPRIKSGMTKEQHLQFCELRHGLEGGNPEKLKW